MTLTRPQLAVLVLGTLAVGGLLTFAVLSQVHLRPDEEPVIVDDGSVNIKQHCKKIDVDSPKQVELDMLDDTPYIRVDHGNTVLHGPLNLTGNWTVTIELQNNGGGKLADLEITKNNKKLKIRNESATSARLRRKTADEHEYEYCHDPDAMDNCVTPPKIRKVTVDSGGNTTSWTIAATDNVAVKFRTVP